MSKRKQDFAVGAFVFAKLKGFAPWPARVMDHYQKQSRRFPVYFFGNFETGNVPINFIFDYETNKHVMATERHRKRKPFRLAYEQIEAALGGDDPTPNDLLDKIKSALETQKEPEPDPEAENSRIEDESNMETENEVPIPPKRKKVDDTNKKNDQSALQSDMDQEDVFKKPLAVAIPRANRNTTTTTTPESHDENIDFVNLLGDKLQFVKSNERGDFIAYLDDTNDPISPANQHHRAQGNERNSKKSNKINGFNIDKENKENTVKIANTDAVPLAFADELVDVNQNEPSPEDAPENIYLLSKKYFKDKYWDKLVLVQMSKATYGIKLTTPKKPKDFLANKQKRTKWETEALTNARKLRDQLELGLISIDDPKIQDRIVKNPTKEEILDFDYEENEEHLEIVEMLKQHEENLLKLAQAIKQNLRSIDKWHKQPNKELQLTNLQQTVLELFYSDGYFMSLLRQPLIVFAVHDLYQYNLCLDQYSGDVDEKENTYQTFQEIRDNAYDILLRWKDLLDLGKYVKHDYVDDDEDFRGFPEALPFIQVFDRFVNHYKEKTKNWSKYRSENIRLTQFDYLIGDFNG